MIFLFLNDPAHLPLPVEFLLKTTMVLVCAWLLYFSIRHANPRLQMLLWRLDALKQPIPVSPLALRWVATSVVIAALGLCGIGGLQIVQAESNSAVKKAQKQEGPRYRVTEVSLSPTAMLTDLIHINNRGEVVGSSDRNVFIWSREKGVTDLGITQGDTQGGEIGLNDEGRILIHQDKYAEGAFGSEEVFPVFTPQPLWVKYFLYQPTSSGYAIHQITPESVSARVWLGPNDTVFRFSGPREPGSIWRLSEWTPKTGFKDIGTLGLGGGVPRIEHTSRGGCLCGSAVTATGESHAFVWTPEKGIQDLHPPGYKYDSRADAVSNHGQVFGWVKNRGNLDWFDWDNGVFRFHQMVNMASFQPGIMNNQGEVLGSLKGPFPTGEARHAALLKNDKIYNLNDLLVNPPEHVLTRACDINDKGQIVASDHDQNRFELGVPVKGFLLDPVEE